MTKWAVFAAICFGRGGSDGSSISGPISSGSISSRPVSAGPVSTRTISRRSNGGGISIPSRKGKKKDQKSEAKQPDFTADGKTVSNDGKKLVIATEDGRTITMAVTPTTKFTHSGADIASSKIVPRTTVHIDASEDDEANLTAVNVELVKDAPAETPEGTRGRPSSPAGGDQAEDRVRPTIMNNPVDAPGRPVLRRGKPKNTDSDDDDSDTVQLAKNKPAPKPAAAELQPTVTQPTSPSTRIPSGRRL